MRKKNLRIPVGIALSTLILLVVFFLLRGTMSRPARVVLPEEGSASEKENAQTAENSDVIARIEVTPETVQSAISSLHRPENYSCKVTVERFFSGGSGKEEGTLIVSSPWSRIDMNQNGETRHVLTDGMQSYIWYGSSKEYYSGAAALNADEELGIPTYESVLDLAPERISSADYRLLDGTDCIYTETVPDSLGYTECYWVSVSTGLLLSAEKRCGEDTVYRMTGSDFNAAEITAEQFTLPDSTVLAEIIS